jgi:hypothetical protein
MAECSSGRILAHRTEFEKIHSKVPLVNRQRALFLPTIALDRASSTPLHLQVFRQIARQVLRDAQYPARTLHNVDPGGTELYLSFR